MKALIFALAFIPSLFAAEFSNTWTEKFEKKVIMSCFQENDFSCEDTCGNKESCEFSESICRDCVGSSVSLTYIFKYMGLNLRSNGNRVSQYEIMDLIQSGDFVSLNAKSIYNHVDRFNSMSLRRKFRSLCENGAREPLVLFEKDSRSQKIGKVRYVVCNEDYLEMEDNPEVILEGEELPAGGLF